MRQINRIRDSQIDRIRHKQLKQEIYNDSQTLNRKYKEKLIEKTKC